MNDLMDYEAHNAKVALDLNKAQQEIERLTAMNAQQKMLLDEADEDGATIERLTVALRKIANGAGANGYVKCIAAEALAAVDKGDT